jgi:hypothetical protein
MEPRHARCSRAREQNHHGLVGRRISGRRRAHGARGCRVAAADGRFACVPQAAPARVRAWPSNLTCRARRRPARCQYDPPMRKRRSSAPTHASKLHRNIRLIYMWKILIYLAAAAGSDNQRNFRRKTPVAFTRTYFNNVLLTTECDYSGRGFEHISHIKEYLVLPLTVYPSSVAILFFGMFPLRALLVDYLRPL